MSWSSLPKEIKERIICFIGDDRIYESIYTNRIRKTGPDIIDSEKKKKHRRRRDSFNFLSRRVEVFLYMQKSVKDN